MFTAYNKQGSKYSFTVLFFNCNSGHFRSWTNRSHVCRELYLSNQCYWRCKYAKIEQKSNVWWEIILTVSSQSDSHITTYSSDSLFWLKWWTTNNNELLIKCIFQRAHNFLSVSHLTLFEPLVVWFYSSVNVRQKGVRCDSHMTAGRVHAVHLFI